MNMWRFSPPPLRKHELRASRYIKHHMNTDVMCKPLKIQFFSVPTEGAVIQQASIKMWSSCRLTDSKQDRSGSLPCGPPASGWLPWGRERRCCWRRCTAATAVWTWARTCRRKQQRLVFICAFTSWNGGIIITQLLQINYHPILMMHLKQTPVILSIKYALNPRGQLDLWLTKCQIKGDNHNWRCRGYCRIILY